MNDSLTERANVTARRVLIHCNAGGDYGMGHLMRSLAIAEEASSREWTVTIFGDLDANAEALSIRVAPDSTIVRVPREELEMWARSTLTRQAVNVLHIDSYWPEADALPRGAALLSNMQDGTYGARSADLAIDANLDAETRFHQPALSTNHLAGITATAIRTQVRERRRSRTFHPGSRPRILVVLGGTDPLGLTATVARELDVLAAPCDVTVICRQEHAQAVRQATEGGKHHVTIHEFVVDLPGLADKHDLVISAAGTSVWDFACMGVPMALLAVVDNQALGYASAVNAGFAFPLGTPPHTDLRERLEALEQHLRRPDDLAERSANLQESVDGLGVWRIVSAWEQLIDNPPTAATDDRTLSARAATIDDGRMLLAWRNDVSTRAVSRNTDPVIWEDHISWLERTLENPERRLLVVQNGTVPVGTVRWDHLGNNRWEVSITAAPEQRGKGLSLAILQAGEAELNADTPAQLVAGIHVDNPASRRLFAKAGYLPYRPADDGGFLTFAKWQFSK